jgi:hypothetical protein
MKLNMFRVTHRPSSGAWRPPTTRPNNFPRTKNQRLPVQFYAPDDGQCVARNMLNFI